MIKRIINYFRSLTKRAVAGLMLDTIMAGASVWFSFVLRLGDDLSQVPQHLMISNIILFMGISGLIFILTGSFRGLWRYVSIGDVLRLVRTVTLIIMVHAVLVFMLTRLQDYPRSTLIINWFVLIAMLGGARVTYRLYRDRSLLGLMNVGDQSKIPVLIIGAGDDAEVFIREMGRDRRAIYRVVGVLTRRPDRVGMHIHGIRVLGLVKNLNGIVLSLRQQGINVQKLIITNDVQGESLRDLLGQADQLGLTIGRSPKVGELNAAVSVDRQVKPIQIEDLLGRAQAALDKNHLKEFLSNRRIIVTGAGGSIGSELTRQICQFSPAELLLLDHGEHALYLIDLEIANSFPEIKRQSRLCDVRDETEIQLLFNDFAPDVVFHAAAYKHVPIVEDNPLEGLLTNVIGTRNVAEAARESGAKAMVQISTDKAVNPTNIMGASKRLAEAYCQALDIASRTAKKETCRYVTVRFGNVLGSSGSVVPLFQKQLESGGPITVTHPDIKRYFMTIREAVSLVLEASWHGVAEAAAMGKIYVLDMGQPVKIVDLARQMIRLAGLTPDKDIKIAFTGLRPGEKLKEELFHGGEQVTQTNNQGLLLASPRTLDYKKLKGDIDRLEKVLSHRKKENAIQMLKELVPEYEVRSE